MSHTSLIAASLVGALAIAAPASARPSSMSQAAAQKPTDATLKDRIEYRLETNNTVKKYDIDVKVDTGIAMLSGTVATAAQKLEAARIAQLDGINRIENDITVDPSVDHTLADRIKGGFSKTGNKISDAWITTKVKWFFTGEDLLKGSDINVDTKNNVVTLKGTVKSTEGRERANELAKNAEGVSRVVDQLTIVK